MYQADLHWMNIKDAIGYYSDDRTLKKNIHFK